MGGWGVGGRSHELADGGQDVTQFATCSVVSLKISNHNNMCLLCVAYDPHAAGFYNNPPPLPLPADVILQQ